MNIKKNLINLIKNNNKIKKFKQTRQSKIKINKIKKKET